MTEAGCQNMSKSQKTFLLNSQLLELVGKVSERTGANFTRIVTAALLQYIFDPALHPEEGVPDGPIAAEWMTFAVRLERGDITLGSIPSNTLKDAALRAEYMLRGGKKDWTEHWKKLRSARQDAIIRWEAVLKEHKGELPAILSLIEECFGNK